MNRLEGHFKQQGGMEPSAKLAAFILAALIGLLAFATGCHPLQADNGGHDCPYNWEPGQSWEDCTCDERGLP